MYLSSCSVYHSANPADPPKVKIGDAAHIYLVFLLLYINFKKWNNDEDKLRGEEQLML